MIYQILFFLVFGVGLGGLAAAFTTADYAGEKAASSWGFVVVTILGVLAFFGGFFNCLIGG